MVDRQNMERIRRDEGEPDARRLMASIALLNSDHQPSHSVALAADLGWTHERTQTAIVAARERGWLRPTPKRVL